MKPTTETNTAPKTTVKRCLIHSDERRDYYSIFDEGGAWVVDVPYTTVLAFAAGDVTLEELTHDS